MKNLNSLLFFTLLLTFISCEDFFETTLELEIPEYEEQVVISAFFDNLEKRDVLLSKTVGLNGDRSKSKVNDATIKIIAPSGDEFFLEEDEAASNSFSRPNYSLPDGLEFEPEQSYTIEVTTREGKVAKGTTIMPKTPELISAIYRPSGGTSIDGDKLEAIDIVFKDEPNVENFYRVQLSYKVGGFNSLYLESNDPSAEESADYVSLILRDVQFDGEEYRLQVLFRGYSSNLETDELVIEFISITEDQYKFDKILDHFLENNDNPFNSPSQLFTNIENGLGLFTIENSVEMEVEN